MIEEKKLLQDMDSKNLFGLADLRDIFKSLKKELYGCIQHCPLCGVVCEVPKKDHINPKEHRQHKHYFPGFFGTKLMIQSESKVEIRLVDNMTCTQIRWLMVAPEDQQDEDDKKKFAESVLNQKYDQKKFAELVLNQKK